MPRFFFDVRDRDSLSRDDHGDQCDDIEEAKLQCKALLPEMFREKISFKDRRIISCDVRDERGDVVYRGTLTFEGVSDPGRDS